MRNHNGRRITLPIGDREGCNALVCACYAAAGFQFGTVLAVAAPASILACNAGLGT